MDSDYLKDQVDGAIEVVGRLHSDLHNNTEAICLEVERIADALSPDPSWPTAKCHECGWWCHTTEQADDGRTQLADCVCLKFNHDPDPNCAACPAFVRRPPAPEAGEPVTGVQDGPQ